MRVAFFIVLIGLLAACESQPMDVSALPEGDAERGAALFSESINGAPTCSSCHALTDERMTGPGLAGYSERAASQVEGESAEEYTYQSIVRPSAHLVEGYGNLMYAEYRSRLSEQQVADLMAYLLTQ
ncbi:MAG: cytochrome c [Anaerolineae bacterium]|nr:cytochrome c [Anaerolineae bacterium]